MDYFDILLAKKLSGGGGGDIEVETLNATENGTYNAGAGKAYNPVVVAVPEPTLIAKNISQNGTYNASDDNADGYSSVTVDVEGYQIKNIANVPTDIASFTDGTDLPMLKLEVGIEAVQSGSGDPSPSNPRPISGWTGAEIHVADGETPHIVDNVVNVSWQTEAGTVYGGELDVTSGLGVKTHVKVDLGTLNWSKNTETETFQDWRSNSIASLIKAISATETPIAWCEEYAVKRRASQTTSYTIGVTSAGNLVIYTAPNEYASGDDLKTALNGVNFVYELATPTDFTFNPTFVKSLDGANNIWADCGDVISGKYFASL